MRFVFLEERSSLHLSVKDVPIEHAEAFRQELFESGALLLFTMQPGAKR